MPRHLYRVTCGALSLTFEATGACEAIVRAIELHGFCGASAKRIA